MAGTGETPAGQARRGAIADVGSRFGSGGRIWSRASRPLPRPKGETAMPDDPSLETLVDAALAQLRERLLRELTEDPARQGTLDEIEAVVERLGQEFRRDLQRRLVEERTTGPRENTAPCACGQHARYHVTRTRVITTRHGEVRLPRPYYYCSACRAGCVPLDTALGLDAGNTTRQ